MNGCRRLAPLCLLPLLILGAGCVSGGGGSLGLYADTRGDVGIGVRGHASLLGFRIADTPDTRPAGAPVFGVELGSAFSFRQDVWHLQTNVPIGAGTWDDTEANHGVRIAPLFVMDHSWRYSGAPVHESYGGGLSTAYLRHLSTDSEHYVGPDAIRIHRLGPVFTAAFLHDKAGWLGSFFLGIMYDFEAYLATGR